MAAHTYRCAVKYSQFMLTTLARLARASLTTVPDDVNSTRALYRRDRTNVTFTSITFAV